MSRRHGRVRISVVHVGVSVVQFEDLQVSLMQNTAATQIMSNMNWEIRCTSKVFIAISTTLRPGFLNYRTPKIEDAGVYLLRSASLRRPYCCVAKL